MEAAELLTVIFIAQVNCFANEIYIFQAGNGYGCHLLSAAHTRALAHGQNSDCVYAVAARRAASCELRAERSQDKHKRSTLPLGC